MNVLFLWIMLWIWVACTGSLILFLVWRWWRDTFARRRIASPSAQTLIGQQFLRAQARLIRLKRQTREAAFLPEEHDTAGSDQASTHPTKHASGRSVFRQVKHLAESLPLWLGWPSALIAFLAIGCVLGGLIWEVQRHPPVPPQAVQLRETIIQGFARQTSYRVPESVDAVRMFYQRELAKQGWHYCGTQATPRCTNLMRAGAEHEIDVYRRPEDHDFSGLTIEIWPQRDPNDQTYVTVFETRLRR
jgi:hypothetical protein